MNTEGDLNSPDTTTDDHEKVVWAYFSNLMIGGFALVALISILFVGYFVWQSSKKFQIDSLVEKERELRRLDSEQPAYQQLIQLRRRLEISNELLQLDLDEKQSRQTKLSKLDALDRMTKLNEEQELNEPEWSQRLDDALSEFASDEDDLVRKRAGILNQFRVAKSYCEQKGSTFEQLSNLTSELLKQFPDDADVAAASIDTCTLLEDSKLGEEGSRLKDLALKNFDSSTSLEVKKIRNRTLHKAAFKDLDLPELSMNVAQNDPEAIRTARELMRLADSPNTSPHVLYKLGIVLESFFSNVQAQSFVDEGAKSLLDAINAKSEKNDEVEAVKSYVEAMRQRHKTIGTKLKLDATTVDGQKLNHETLAGKSVLVLTGTMESELSLMALEHLTRLDDTDPELLVFVVVIKNATKEYLSRIAKESPHLKIVEESTCSLFSDLSLTVFPYMVLTTKDQTIKYMNLHPVLIRSTFDLVELIENE